MQKWVLITLGTWFVILAVIGVFVPILPTTPFLLLAAACYAKSSEKFYHWLVNSRYIGQYIRNYRAGKGMPLHTKVLTLTLLWATIGYSIFAVVDAPAMRLLLLLIAVGVTIHLSRLPNLRR